MPELPEVETITNNIRPKLLNEQISDCAINWERTIAYPLAARFKEQIKNQRVTALTRRGKYIQIHLDQDTLLIHLRMSGDLYLSTEQEPNKHDQLIISMVSGKKMVFNDTRKFGRVWLTDEPVKILSKLGPEPLSREFTAELLYSLLRSKKRQLKPLLLDQSFIAGLGNIYTDESLFEARLSPYMNSADVTETQSVQLRDAIQKVLRKGIQNNGASIDWVYKGGKFQDHFQVYQRTGSPCRICGTPIKKVKLGQRGTHFCPTCQTVNGE